MHRRGRARHPRGAGLSQNLRGVLAVAETQLAAYLRICRQLGSELHIYYIWGLHASENDTCTNAPLGLRYMRDTVSVVCA